MKTIQFLFASIGAMLLSAGLQAGEISVKKLPDEGKVRVEIDGKLFTEYISKGWRKPVLYPVIGPHGIGMTRNYPFKKGVKGEKADHPHHTSIPFTHGKVNGVDFWHKQGDIVQTKLTRAAVENGVAVIEADHDWKNGDKLIATDTTVIRAGEDKDVRFIDFQITIKASNGELTFGDTKEGTMGIRTHPGLRLNSGAKGRNSEGVLGKAVWGKKAKWVSYSGEIDGHEVGITVMDHPANPRHPTTWHARDYGLLAANPFGLSHFLGKKHDGTMVVNAGESVTFKYRFLFHPGDAEDVNADGRLEAWAAE